MNSGESLSLSMSFPISKVGKVAELCPEVSRGGHSRGLTLQAIFSGGLGQWPPLSASSQMGKAGPGAPQGARENVLTWLSMPSISSIEKKRMDQRGEMGSWVTASGYARNASPGPVGERIKNINKT